MATNWTAADLASVDETISMGALKVRYADGREVSYRSLSDLLAIRRIIADAIAPSSPPPRRAVAGYNSGL